MERLVDLIGSSWESTHRQIAALAGEVAGLRAFAEEATAGLRGARLELQLAPARGQRDGVGAPLTPGDGVELHWLPLGRGRILRAAQRPRLRGGGRAVGGRAPSATCTTRRSPCTATAPVTVVEMTPSTGGPPGPDARRGGGGAGRRAAGSPALRVLRYEIRCWRDGMIGDIDEAVGDPLRLSDDAEVARRIIAPAPQVPPPPGVATSAARARCGTRTR